MPDWDDSEYLLALAQPNIASATRYDKGNGKLQYFSQALLLLQESCLITMRLDSAPDNNKAGERCALKYAHLDAQAAALSGNCPDGYMQVHK